MIHGKRVLITGGAGFLGTSLFRRLSGQNEVWLVDSRRITPASAVGSAGVVQVNLEKRDALDRLKGSFDYLFHFGAPSSVVLFRSDFWKSSRSALLGLTTVLEFARARRTQWLVIPSSGNVYTRSARTHQNQVRPTNFYALTKVYAEAAADLLPPEVTTVTPRIFMGYGPGEEQKGEIASPVCLFLKAGISERKPIVWGDGEQRRDLVFIDDVTDILSKVDQLGPGRHTFDIGTGVPTSFNQIIRIISGLLGRNISPLHHPLPPQYVGYTKANPHTAQRLLGRQFIEPTKGIDLFYAHLTSAQGRRG